MLRRKGDIGRTDSGRRNLAHRVGEDESEHRAQSPAPNAHRIRAPVMLSPTAAATFVPRRNMPKPCGRHWKSMACRWCPWSKPGRRTGFYDDENRIRSYREILAFLRKHAAG